MSFSMWKAHYLLSICNLYFSNACWHVEMKRDNTKKYCVHTKTKTADCVKRFTVCRFILRNCLTNFPI